MLNIKRLLICLSIVLFSGVAQDAFAARFGLQTGFYNESLRTPCASSREFGLRLGFYADKTTNDIIYAAAMNGIDLCGANGTCGTPQYQQVVAVPQTCAVAPAGCSASYAQVAAPVGCGSGRFTNPHAIVPPSCGSSVVTYAAPMVAPAPCAQQAIAQAPVIQQAAPAKTEIYLLVLPESKPVTYNNYSAPSMAAQPQYVAPQGYYREPVEQQPVRGYW